MARTVLLVVGGLIATVAVASAQDPVSSFESLGGRVQLGQHIRVTDATGREIRGRLERISSEELLVLVGRDRVTFSASDVRRVRARDRDPLKNGTLIGLGIGGGLGMAWCVGAIADSSGDLDARVECAEGLTVFPGLGALIGLVVDAVIRGKMRLAYQALRPTETSRTGVAVSPLVTSRMEGVVVSFVF